MVVTIDGPAGAGKSTVARRLAERLGFRFLDTGAMYRAVALAALGRQIDWRDEPALAELAEQLDIRFEGQRLLLDGQDVSERIRQRDVTRIIHHVADNPRVRRRLVELQRALAEGRDIVTEGRDQGTVAFPDARCKIFLTASPEERARRRHGDLAARGEQASFAEVLDEQNERDRRDASRPVGRLQAAGDATHVSTDGRTVEQVVDQLEALVRMTTG